MLTTEIELAAELEANMKSYPDFPKAGILFRDIMPIFLQSELVDRLCKWLADEYRGRVDVIVALEARAIDLHVPFVPLRKPGKLPGPLLSASYEKEYGKDVIELQEDVLHVGQRVLLLDDLLATGGTIGAAIELVHKSGAKVTDIFCVVELTGLAGRRRIPDGIETRAILKYD